MPMTIVNYPMIIIINHPILFPARRGKLEQEKSVARENGSIKEKGNCVFPRDAGKQAVRGGPARGREHGDFNSNMNHAEKLQKRIAQNTFPAQRRKFKFRRFSLGGGGPDNSQGLTDHPLFKFSRVTREIWS